MVFENLANKELLHKNPNETKIQQQNKQTNKTSGNNKFLQLWGFTTKCSTSSLENLNANSPNCFCLLVFESKKPNTGQKGIKIISFNTDRWYWVEKNDTVLCLLRI